MMKNVSFRIDYSRVCRMVSCAALPIALLGPAMASSQTPAQAARAAKDAPTLRAVAVLEWTGDDETKPKTSRLVPISIYDGQALEDAGLYLARPEPLSLAGEVEYQLKQNGKTTGLFIIKNAAQEQGSWVGYGEWKPAPAAKPLFAAAAPVSDEDNEEDDKPTLHRKHHDDEGSGGGTGSPGSTGSSGSKPSDDSDRPTLHKKSDSGTGTSSSGNSGSTPSSSPASPSSDDSDRPTLHKKSSDDSTTATTPSDPDRPVMKKPKKQEEDIGHSSALPNITDPDRPRLVRGQDNSQSLKVLPSLMGLPPDMRQTVGVSDTKDKPDHPWSYTWANPADEAKMKAALEDQARIALGLAPSQPASARPASPKRLPAQHVPTQSRATPAHKPVEPAPATPPTLEGEQFRVFELAYGSGATLVLSAHTAGDPQTRKYVTLIAQPDLYGNLAILRKSVTDAAHLDEKPRMILVDAVDALADNRGELLFELRGATGRQFALYRVLRGNAEQIFATNLAEFGSLTAQ